MSYSSDTSVLKLWCHTAVTPQCVKVVMSYSSDTPVFSCFDVILQWYTSVLKLCCHTAVIPQCVHVMMSYSSGTLVCSCCEVIEPTGHYQVYSERDVTESAFVCGILHQLTVHGPELVKLIWGTQPHVIWSHVRPRTSQTYLRNNTKRSKSHKKSIEAQVQCGTNPAKALKSKTQCTN